MGKGERMSYSEHITTHLIFGRGVSVYGCLDTDTPEGEYEFFDIFDHDSGECLNEGNPFETVPTPEELTDYLRTSDKEEK
jgi:hypothetical protein